MASQRNQTVLKKQHQKPSLVKMKAMKQTFQLKAFKIWRLTLSSVKNWEFLSQNREVGPESKALTS